MDDRKELVAKSIYAIVGAVVILISGIYIKGLIDYDSKFCNNTYINGTDVSNLGIYEAAEQVSGDKRWSKLGITLNGEVITTIKPADIGYVLDTLDKVYNVHSKFDRKLWLLNYFKEKRHNIEIDFSYDNGKLREILDDLQVEKIESQDAEIAYSDLEKEYIVQAESYGNIFKRSDLDALVNEALNNYKESIDLMDISKKPDKTKDDIELNLLKDSLNKFTGVVITYDFADRQEIIDRDIIKDWIITDGNNIDLDFEMVKAYIVELAKVYDTYGDSRPFTTSRGKDIKISGGSYGWLMHRTDTANALIEVIKAGKDATIKPVYSFEVDRREVDDIGNTYVEISIKDQMVWVYENGELMVETPAVTGNLSRGYDTPTGIYPLTYKTRNATLRGPGYASPVKYWMPFNMGIGLHDANWRSTFGGNIYKTDGSHGCINLPTERAKQIYDIVYAGMPIIVY